MAHSKGDRDEPILADTLLGLRYRLVRGVRAFPFVVTHAAWEELRGGLVCDGGDVWVTGYPGAGNLLVQYMVRLLHHGGDVQAVCAAEPSAYACGITDHLECGFSRDRAR